VGLLLLAGALLGALYAKRETLLKDRDAARAPEAVRNPPDIVLVVIDNLRADHLGVYGDANAHSPVIDRLAAEGTRFTRAVSASSWTRPSIASLFTSRLPSEHGAIAFGHDLGPELPTLAERLAAAGYHTVGISGNFIHITSETGMARGFDAWRTVSIRVAASDAEDLWFGRRAPTGVEIDQSVLAMVPPPGGRPLFLYVHFMEPHVPFAPSRQQRLERFGDPAGGGAPVRSEYLTDLAAGRVVADEAERARILSLYDAEIASVDEDLGTLLEGLAQRGYRNLVVALVSDHGEEFGEHGMWFHGMQLYQESITVPIILHGGPVPVAVRDEPVDLLDVPTTLLALAGAPPIEGARGRDLLAPRLSPRDLISELHSDPAVEARIRPREQRSSLQRWPLKIILGRDGTHRFYDLARDPGEQDPASTPDTPDAERLARELDTVSPSVVPGTTGPPELDDATRDALRSLGYAE